MGGLLGEIMQAPTRPSKERMATYGNRPDGTPKGAGYFGEIPHPKKPGVFSTELSIGVNFDGEETQIPLLVPTLSRQDIDAVIAGKDTDAIVRKAVDHAKMRLQQGKSPYAAPDEFYDLPSK